MLPEALYPVKTLLNILHAVTQSDGTPVRARHRVFARSQRPKQPADLRRLEFHVDLYRGATGDCGANIAPDFIERSRAQLAFRDFQNLENNLLNFARSDARRSRLDGDGALAEWLGLKAVRNQLVRNPVTRLLTRTLLVYRHSCTRMSSRTAPTVSLMKRNRSACTRLQADRSRVGIRNRHNRITLEHAPAAQRNTIGS